MHRDEPGARTMTSALTLAVKNYKYYFGRSSRPIVYEVGASGQAGELAEQIYKGSKEWFNTAASVRQVEPEELQTLRGVVDILFIGEGVNLAKTLKLLGSRIKKVKLIYVAGRVEPAIVKYLQALVLTRADNDNHVWVNSLIRLG